MVQLVIIMIYVVYLCMYYLSIIYGFGSCLALYTSNRGQHFVIVFLHLYVFSCVLYVVFLQIAMTSTPPGR